MSVQEPETQPVVLVVDDEARYRRVIAMLLSDLDVEVREAGSGKEALAEVEARPPRLVITDLRMPGMSGVELLGRLQDDHPGLPVVVITAYGSIESAVDAMRRGAYDYVTKPFEEATLVATVRRALECSLLRETCSNLREEVEARWGMDRILGRSDTLRAALDLAAQVAPTQATVLVTGESGTGKELLARALHYASARAGGPFVAVNCAAIPSGLLESELFGHEKGAFSGATARRHGRFELAAGGTLFLDEVGEMEPLLQVKLLRVLQERTFERVGGDRPRRADVRVVCATNLDLEAAVRQGRFRKDLYYRINVFPIRLPALRERGDDVLLLARHFLGRFAGEMGRRVTDLSPQAEAALLGHPWEGNVRELRNVIERAVILCRGPLLGVEHVPAVAGGGPAPPPAPGDFVLPPGGVDLEALERDLVAQAMAAAGGNKSRAAALLGLTRATLRYRLGKYGLGGG